MFPDEIDQDGQLFKTGFELGLAKLGWIDGRNVLIDYRWGAGEIDRMRRFATELVGLRPDVLLGSDTATLAALQEATQSIPIVFALVADPIGGRFVASLARPGGNITGFIPIEPPMVGKWLEMLKDAAPQTRRVEFLYNPETTPYAGAFLRYAETVAAASAVELISQRPQHHNPPLRPSYHRHKRHRRWDSRSFGG
jgi:putative tryptophan/tyrosine transport system substrate-binding protein